MIIPPSEYGVLYQGRKDFEDLLKTKRENAKDKDKVAAGKWKQLSESLISEALIKKILDENVSNTSPSVKIYEGYKVKRSQTQQLIIYPFKEQLRQELKKDSQWPLLLCCGSGGSKVASLHVLIQGVGATVKLRPFADLEGRCSFPRYIEQETSRYWDVWVAQAFRENNFCLPVLNVSAKVKGELSSPLVIPYCSKGTLEQRFHNGNYLTQEQMDQLVKALHDLHARNIVHFDLTSRNILVDLESQIKIIDFEKAYSGEDPGRKIVRAYALCGGFGTADPESFQSFFASDRTVLTPLEILRRGKPTDVFAVGSLLWWSMQRDKEGAMFWTLCHARLKDHYPETLNRAGEKTEAHEKCKELLQVVIGEFTRKRKEHLSKFSQECYEKIVLEMLHPNSSERITMADAYKRWQKLKTAGPKISIC